MMEIDKTLISKYADDAKEAATPFNLKFNNNTLLNTLDIICSELHKQLKDIKKDYSGDYIVLINSMAIKNAAVLVLVIKNQLGDEYCHWYKDHPRLGANTYPLYLGELELFPKQWFLDAIIKGKRNHIEKMVINYIPDLAESIKPN